MIGSFTWKDMKGNIFRKKDAVLLQEGGGAARGGGGRGPLAMGLSIWKFP